MLGTNLPQAKLIWSSSTPATVQGKPTDLDAEINSIIIEHNRMAAAVMKVNIAVNDLYSLLIDKRELSRGERCHWTGPCQPDMP